MIGVGYLKRICKDVFSVAGAVRNIFIRAIGGLGKKIKIIYLHFLNLNYSNITN